MGPEIIAALIGIAGTLVVGGPTVWYARKSYRLEVERLQKERDNAKAEMAKAQAMAETYRKRIQEAPKTFAEALGTLIQEASIEVDRAAAKPGSNQLVPAAKALVASRDGFAAILEAMRERLNSEIRALKYELDKANPDLKKIAELIETLRRKWGAKKVEIEMAIRKILTELGLFSSTTVIFWRHRRNRTAART